jgi:hypothetical protein
MDVSEELRPAAVANRAANASNNTPDTDQLAANYDEIKADGESPRKKIFGGARIVRKSLIE